MLKYIQYILQFSTLAYILAALILLLGIVHLIRKRQIASPYYLISLCWFLIPFLVGFFYSKYVNAVLQYSVLIFTFPFMLYSFFGLLPNLKIKSQLVIVIAICSVNVFALVHKRQYYQIFYQSHFERQVLINDSVFKKMGQGNFIALASTSPDSITAFYTRKNHVHFPYVWMPDSSSKLNLVQYLEKHKTPYLTYDYAATSDLLYLPVILNYYPYVALQNNAHEGTNFIFTSDPNKGKSPYIFQSIDNYFYNHSQYWGEADKAMLSNQRFVKTSMLPAPYSSLLSSQIPHDSTFSYSMDSLHEWAPNFEYDLSKMTDNKHNLIFVSLSVYPLSTMKDVEIVCELQSGGKQIHYSGTPVSEFISDTTRHQWVKAYHAIKLPDINLNYPDIKVKVYIWNRGKRNFYMQDFAVRTIEGNPIIYWLVEKI